MRLLAFLPILGAALLARAKQPADEFQTSAGVVKITPIRHASLMIEGGGQVVQVDPVGEGYEGLPGADLILITHEHFDHMDPALLPKIRKPGCVVVAPAVVAETVSPAVALANGESKQFGPWKIEAVAAYNIQRGPAPGQLWHPKGQGNGYVVAYGGKRFYISGDTEGVPEMRALKGIDVAFLCMNLPYTMSPEEAAAAVRAFKPGIVYPYHYRGTDLSVFQKALAGSGIEVRIRDWYL